MPQVCRISASTRAPQGHLTPPNSVPAEWRSRTPSECCPTTLLRPFAAIKGACVAEVPPVSPHLTGLNHVVELMKKGFDGAAEMWLSVIDVVRGLMGSSDVVRGLKGNAGASWAEVLCLVGVEVVKGLTANPPP